METDKIELLGKTLEIVRPRFYFGDGFDNPEKEFWLGAAIDATGGAVQEYGGIQKDYRHIAVAEIAELMNFHENNRYRRKIFAELFLAYLLEKGLDVEEHSWQYGIFCSGGIRREGANLIIYKNIDRKLKILYNGWDMAIGYCIKEEAVTSIEQKSFGMERLFRKYDENNLTLKEIDKSNPDLIEYLFEQEYEKLPLYIQKAVFILPPDFLKKSTSSWEWGKSDIWPLSMDFSVGLAPDKYRVSDKYRIDIGKLEFKTITIWPLQICCGMHCLIKETESGK